MSASLALTRTVEKSSSNSACMVTKALKDIYHDQSSVATVLSLFKVLCRFCRINGVLSRSVQYVMLSLLMCIPGGAEMTNRCALHSKLRAWLVHHLDWLV